MKNIFSRFDALGSNIVPKVSLETEDTSKHRISFIGNQAASLKTSPDRILALKHLTTSMHVLLSRIIILKILSLLSITTNCLSLISCLKLMGLTDITKLVQLMILVAMNRVEISCITNGDNTCNIRIPNDFSQLLSNFSLSAYSCLYHLSTIIAALAQSEEKAFKSVIDICTRDLLKCALGTSIPKYSFAVTQSLVNILSTNGGCFLLNLPKEETSNVSTENNEQQLELLNSLAAVVISKKVDRTNYRQWAAQQLFKCLATKFQVTTGNTTFLFSCIKTNMFIIISVLFNLL